MVVPVSSVCYERPPRLTGSYISQGEHSSLRGNSNHPWIRTVYQLYDSRHSNLHLLQTLPMIIVNGVFVNTHCGCAWLIYFELQPVHNALCFDMGKLPLFLLLWYAFVYRWIVQVHRLVWSLILQVSPWQPVDSAARGSFECYHPTWIPVSAYQYRSCVDSSIPFTPPVCIWAVAVVVCYLKPPKLIPSLRGTLFTEGGSRELLFYRPRATYKPTPTTHLLVIMWAEANDIPAESLWPTYQVSSLAG